MCCKTCDELDGATGPATDELVETALLICDRCLMTQCFGHYETLLTLAREAGWWMSGEAGDTTGFHICPACLEGRDG